ncbi:MAG: FAD-binding protein [Clostridia bacterium]|nr:FAD-binding protein [Clostridia bacterium]
MIKVSNIKAPVGSTPEQIKALAAQAAGLAVSEVKDFSMARLSIDARRKSDVHLNCAVTFSAGDEPAVVKRASSGNVTLFIPETYAFPQVKRRSELRPVVVGMGPAGLFAALELAKAGLRPIVLERGKNVDERLKDVMRFWNTGSLLTSSNVQFGEGGAGTFSDGKLATGISDRRISHVFETFVQHGAPVDITYSNKPHIGTDVLREVVKSMRQEMASLGAEVRFESTLSEINITGGAVREITVSTASGAYDMPCDTLILAPGHSARDCFEMLLRAGVPMERKAFAIGVRIEHKQKSISAVQYGEYADSLPPADYKLSCHLPNGRSAFSFCVCPGGQVIAVASEFGGVVTNGMSLRARNGENINGGLLVGVTAADFEGGDPLAGVRFQRLWEEHAFALGGGDYKAPAQTVGDFIAGRTGKTFGAVNPSYQPSVVPADLSGCLPKYVCETLKGAIPAFDRSLHGFADPQAVLTGVETRSSSPVRILRGEDFESKIKGLYPCGEGAGYAGGITSAAVDGIKVAEAVAEKE